MPVLISPPSLSGALDAGGSRRIDAGLPGPLEGRVTGVVHGVGSVAADLPPLAGGVAGLGAGVTVAARVDGTLPLLRAALAEASAGLPAWVFGAVAGGLPVIMGWVGRPVGVTAVSGGVDGWMPALAASIAGSSGSASSTTGAVDGVLPGTVGGAFSGAVEFADAIVGRLPGPLAASMTGSVPVVARFGGIVAMLPGSLSCTLAGGNALACRVRGGLPRTLTATLAGRVAHSGSIHAVLPAPTADLYGGHQRLRVRLPAISGRLSGVVAAGGSLRATLPELVGALRVTVWVDGRLDGRLPLLHALVTGGGARAGIVGRLPAPVAGRLAARVGVAGSLSGALPRLRGGILGAVPVGAAIRATLPPLAASIWTGAPGAAWAFSVNLPLAAVSRHVGLPLGEVGVLAGHWLIVNEDGLYQLDPGRSADDETPIGWHFTSGWNNLGSDALKRAREVWADLASDAPVSVCVAVDAGECFTYPLPDRPERLGVRKTPVGRGMRGQRFAAGAAGDGAVEITRLVLALDETRRKV